jgi:hypothetical protein
VLDAAAIAAALEPVRARDVDVLAVQELDVAQPRSGRVDQSTVVAEALGAHAWRFAPTLAGTPGLRHGWRPHPEGTDDLPPTTPRYGIALYARRPVRRWHLLPLGHGKGRLPVAATHPTTGRSAVLWIHDEPRVALAAELVDGGTVVGTHLSFAPWSSVGQVRRLARWARTLPAPVLLAGDLNLPGRWPARLTGGRQLVDAATFPASGPRLQLDHVVALDGARAGRGGGDGGSRSGLAAEPFALHLGVGDHRLVGAHVCGVSPAAGGTR